MTQGRCGSLLHFSYDSFHSLHLAGLTGAQGGQTDDRQTKHQRITSGLLTIIALVLGGGQVAASQNKHHT